MAKVEISHNIAIVDYEFYKIKGGIATYYKYLFYLLSDAGFSVVLFCSVSSPIEAFIYKKSKIIGVVSSDIDSFRKSLIAPFCHEHQLQKFTLVESSEVNHYCNELFEIIKDVKFHIRTHAPNYLLDLLNKTYIPFWKKIRYILGGIRIGKLDLGYWKKYNTINDQEFLYSQKANILSSPTIAMKNWIDLNWSLNTKKKVVYPNPFIPNLFSSVKPLTSIVQYKSILFFGRLNVLKGLRNLTFALSKILSNNPEWRFIVIGDDGPSPTYSNLSMKDWMKIKLSNVINQVEFHDSMPNEDLFYFLEKSEVVVLPSLFESFSYACLEAMSAGRVVIGSTSGGMGSFINHGQNGFLINPYCISDIYRNLDYLIQNQNLIFQVGENARNYIQVEYAYQKQVNYFTNVYNEILN